MRARIRFIAPLAVAVALTAACGNSGSSGTGGGSGSSGNASGDTCAPVAGDKLVVLEDDKHLQNADNLIPIVNKADLAKHPEIATAINPLASVLTTADLGTLDNQVDGQRQTVADVATAYLTSKGLL